jgi:hypothetical protein
VSKLDDRPPAGQLRQDRCVAHAAECIARPRHLVRLPQDASPSDQKTGATERPRVELVDHLAACDG